MTNLDKMNLIILAVGVASLLDKAVEEENPSLEKAIEFCEILLTALKKHEENLKASEGAANLSDGSDQSDKSDSARTEGAARDPESGED